MKDITTAIVNGPSASWEIPRLPKVKIPRFDLHMQTSPERQAIEHYIQARFWQAHNAQVSHFLPNIISLHCSDNYSAAVGLAPAINSRLFAETYLADPIEIAIAKQVGFSVERGDIIEIGNLVSTWKGSSLLLFIFIGELIERLGYRWIMFTATREVQALLARLHYEPVVLAHADPSLLPDGGASWGRYYDNQPRVMFGDVRPAIEAARKNPMYRTAVAAINRQINKLCAEYRELNPLATKNSAHSQGDDHE